MFVSRTGATGQVNAIAAPTLQSQINKIQNQLLGQSGTPNFTNISNMAMPMSNVNATTATTLTTATAATSNSSHIAHKPTKKKQSTKRKVWRRSPNMRMHLTTNSDLFLCLQSNSSNSSRHSHRCVYRLVADSQRIAAQHTMHLEIPFLCTQICHCAPLSMSAVFALSAAAVIRTTATATAANNCAQPNRQHSNIASGSHQVHGHPERQSGHDRKSNSDHADP